ncbi:MAG: hypothetical protein Tsb0020_42870 [Haliangiales bacterium]
MDQTDFLKPHLKGERFKGAAIPLEMLRDLALLEEMVTEVAKWVYLQRHPGRTRSPRGFTGGVEFRLTRVEDGSAIPVISLDFAEVSLPAVLPTIEQCYVDARDAIVGVMAEAQDQVTPTKLPPKYLAYFDRFGRSLQDDEAIEFTIEGRPTPVRFTRVTRKRLVDASKLQSTTEEVILRGGIHEANQETMSFELRLVDGRKASGPISEEYRDSIMDAFNGYRDGIRVAIRGIARFSRAGRLEDIVDVDSVSLLDPLDVAARVDELRSLKDGWLEGHGEAPSDAALTWFTDTFDTQFDDELPLPYVFPTEAGGLRLEWELGGADISVDMDLQARRGEYHSLAPDGSTETTGTLELGVAAGWAKLRSLLLKEQGEE